MAARPLQLYTISNAQLLDFLQDSESVNDSKTQSAAAPVFQQLRSPPYDSRLFNVPFSPRIDWFTGPSKKEILNILIRKAYSNSIKKDQTLISICEQKKPFHYATTQNIINAWNNYRYNYNQTSKYKDQQKILLDGILNQLTEEQFQSILAHNNSPRKPRNTAEVTQNALIAKALEDFCFPEQYSLTFAALLRFLPLSQPPNTLSAATAVFHQEGPMASASEPDSQPDTPFFNEHFENTYLRSAPVENVSPLTPTENLMNKNIYNAIITRAYELLIQKNPELHKSFRETYPENDPNRNYPAESLPHNVWIDYLYKNKSITMPYKDIKHGITANLFNRLTEPQKSIIGYVLSTEGTNMKKSLIIANIFEKIYFPEGFTFSALLQFVPVEDNPLEILESVSSSVLP